MAEARAADSDRDRMLRSAVRIRYERTENGAVITGHGTAFGVDLSAWGLKGRRYLLSAAHNVLDDARKPFGTLKIEITEGTRTYWSQCTVLKVDPDLDVCLLQSGDDVPEICALSEFDAQAGDDCVMAGSPRGIPVALYDGVMRHRYYQGSVRSVVDIQFDHGCSGGPLFSARTGKAVGIAVAGIPMDGDLDHACGLFVPINAVYDFLSTYRAPLQRRPAAVAQHRAIPPAVVSAAAAAASSEPPAQAASPAPTSSVAATTKVATSQPMPASIAAAAPNTPARPLFVAVESLKPAPAVAAARLPEPSSSARNIERPRRAEAAAVVEASSQTSTPAIEFFDPADTQGIPAVYVIEEGDNLSRIARRYNVPIQSLIALNNIKNPNRILVGARLRLK